MKRYFVILVVLGLVCSACQSCNKAKGEEARRQAGFIIEQRDDTTHLTIYSPWQKENVMQDIVIDRCTVERIACTSATHVGFIKELGMMDKVVGVTTPKLIYSLTDADRERITDIGNDINLNKEALLLCKPEVVIVSSYGQGDDRHKQIEALGIPVIYCQEWTESTPLARAEWIRVFGAVLGCRPKADSIYASVREEYEQLKCLNVSESKSKSIMSGMSFRGTWYVPAGETFMGHLFRDARAVYKYEDNPSTSSIPLTLEQALQDFAEADVWVGCNAHSLNELEAIDKKHTWFKSYQTEQVYNFYKRTLPSGANDFWESGVVHPERILQDLQKVLTGDTTGLYYTHKLDS